MDEDDNPIECDLNKIVAKVTVTESTESTESNKYLKVQSQKLTKQQMTNLHRLNSGNITISQSEQKRKIDSVISVE